MTSKRKAIHQQLSQQQGYKANAYQTYLTTPEWRNVDMAVELSQHLRKGKSFHAFPYFKHIYLFWYIFAKSFKSAWKKHSFSELMSSEYSMMNIFIGTFSTIGHLAKGLFSLPWSLLLNKNNHTSFQKHMASLIEEYANFIHHTPFYNFPYAEKIKPMWHAFYQAPDKTITDTLMMCYSTFDLIGRMIISSPVAYWYNQPENMAPETISVLLTSFSSDKEVERTALEKLGAEILDIFPDPSEAYPGRSHIHAKFPRYGEFEKALKSLSALISQPIDEKTALKLAEIAGQENIQIDFEVNKELDLDSYPVTSLYQYENYVDNDKKVIVADVPVKSVFEALYKAEQDPNINIKLIHDY